MLEHLCVDLEQESKEALATWVLVQIYTQSSFLCLYHCSSTRYGWYGSDRTTFFGWYANRTTIRTENNNFEMKKGNSLLMSL
jgi:hypothetical protein